MALGAGLAGQIGYGEEVTYGTPVTPTRFLRYLSEELNLTFEELADESIGGGEEFELDSRWVRATRSAEGPVMHELQTTGMGMLFKHMLGAAPTISNLGGAPIAYSHLYVPGDTATSLTVQAGEPDTGGTVRPKTMHGGMIMDWTLGVDVGGKGTLELAFDGEDIDNTTGLAVASYTDAALFDFTQATLKADTVALSVASAASVSCGNPRKTDRYFLGSVGRKARPIRNAKRPITGSFTSELNGLAEVYDRYLAGTAVALELLFEGATISGANKHTIKVTLPKVRFTSGMPSVSGPDVLETSVDFTARKGTSGNAIELTYITTDAAA